MTTTDLILLSGAMAIGAGSLAWFAVLLKRAAYDVLSAALNSAAGEIR